jgi:hypothetical protein
MDGLFGTAIPYMVENKLCLVIWLDVLEPLDQLLLTHELGHFVLSLQGYKLLIDNNLPSGVIGGNLNPKLCNDLLNPVFPRF